MCHQPIDIQEAVKKAARARCPVGSPLQNNEQGKEKQMSDLTPRERELVAIAAAIGSNCVPCVEYHIPVARKIGMTDGQIGEAIELANKVKQVPASKVYETAQQLVSGGSQQKQSGSCCEASETNR
jgi:AhpD family alkylhydroperoxidase